MKGNRDCYGRLNATRFSSDAGYRKDDRGGPPFKRQRQEEPENHILLLTIENDRYPITVKVIEAICKPHGRILRIVIFRKSVVHALVEFEDIGSARDAKRALHGADIYSGCCTINAEYAKTPRLNVKKNDDLTFDFTDPDLPSSYDDRGDGGKRTLLFQTPGDRDVGRRSGEGPGFGCYGGGFGPADEHYSGSSYGPRSLSRNDGWHGDGMGMQMGMNQMMRGPQMDMSMSHRGGPGFGCVMMVYGLNMKMFNTQRLFNLLCLYGDVMRIKFLMTKAETAMVEMREPDAVQKCIDSLDGVTIFNSRVQIKPSKQNKLEDLGRSFQLEDGSESFADFYRSKNHRYATPALAAKNRYNGPSKVLHFYNAPPKMSEDDVKKVFDDVGAPIPTEVIPKDVRGDPERSSVGTVVFRTVEEGIEALVLANHHELFSPGSRYPFVFKLCFSGSGGSGPPYGRESYCDGGFRGDDRESRYDRRGDDSRSGGFRGRGFRGRGRGGHDRD